MSLSLTTTNTGILFQETGQPDLLFEKKLSSITEAPAGAVIDGLVNKNWTRKYIPVANLTINGVAFTRTPIDLVKKIRDEVFIDAAVNSPSFSIFSESEVTSLKQLAANVQS